jgi:hypothetical protein
LPHAGDEMPRGEIVAKDSDSASVLEPIGGAADQRSSSTA